MPEWSAPTPRNREDSIRAFFALWPDASASDALALLACETARRTQGRAPPSGNLHLTLVFLGDVAVTRVTALCAIGLAAASTVPPFPLTLDRTGTFRGSGIAWAGASATPRELDEFVQQLRDKLDCDAVLMQLPIGKEDNFEGVVDLVAQKAYYFDGANGEKVRVEDPPADMVDAMKASAATPVMLQST